MLFFVIVLFTACTDIKANKKAHKKWTNNQVKLPFEKNFYQKKNSNKTNKSK